MENKVGDNLPTAAEIEKRIKLLDEMIVWLRKFCINLNDEERRGLTRGRRGIEPHLAQMADLAKKYGFNAPGATPDQLHNDLRLGQDLAALSQRLSTASELVQDTLDQGRSEANEAGYMYYGIAQSMKDRIPEIGAQIKDFAEFLSSTRRRKGTKDGEGGGDNSK